VEGHGVEKSYLLLFFIKKKEKNNFPSKQTLIKPTQAYFAFFLLSRLVKKSQKKVLVVYFSHTERGRTLIKNNKILQSNLNDHHLTHPFFLLSFPLPSLIPPPKKKGEKRKRRRVKKNQNQGVFFV